jgi:hypothetical protein
MPSRYKIEPSDLRSAALTLQVGAGIAARLSTIETTNFIEQGEEWAEDQVSEYLGVPLKPTPARGTTNLPNPLTKSNYPREFILAIIYWSVGRMLQSEYFANEPNASQSGQWAEGMAAQHIKEFRSRVTTRVGSGRRRNPNPFIPPNIAPREQPPESPSFQ